MINSSSVFRRHRASVKVYVPKVSRDNHYLIAEMPLTDKLLELVVGKIDPSAEKPYQKSLYNKLSQKIKNEIIDLASSDLMITTAAKYMKIFPILTRVDVGHIIPRENTNLRAAMLWHKDTFGFKSLDFFMIITNVDENNGPLICLEKKIKAGVLKSCVSKNLRRGERGKVDLNEFSKIFGRRYFSTK